MSLFGVFFGGFPYRCSGSSTEYTARKEKVSIAKIHFVKWKFRRRRWQIGVKISEKEGERARTSENR